MPPLHYQRIYEAQAREREIRSRRSQFISYDRSCKGLFSKNLVAFWETGGCFVTSPAIATTLTPASFATFPAPSPFRSKMTTLAPSIAKLRTISALRQAANLKDFSTLPYTPGSYGQPGRARVKKMFIGGQWSVRARLSSCVQSDQTSRSPASRGAAARERPPIRKVPQELPLLPLLQRTSIEAFGGQEPFAGGYVSNYRDVPADLVD